MVREAMARLPSNSLSFHCTVMYCSTGRRARLKLPASSCRASSECGGVSSRTSNLPANFYRSSYIALTSHVLDGRSLAWMINRTWLFSGLNSGLKGLNPDFCCDPRIHSRVVVLFCLYRPPSPRDRLGNCTFCASLLPDMHRFATILRWTYLM